MTGSVRAKALVKGGPACGVSCDVGPIRENLSDFLTHHGSIAHCQPYPTTAVQARREGGDVTVRIAWRSVSSDDMAPNKAPMAPNIWRCYLRKPLMTSGRNRSMINCNRRS